MCVRVCVYVCVRVCVCACVCVCVCVCVRGVKIDIITNKVYSIYTSHYQKVRVSKHTHKCHQQKGRREGEGGKEHNLCLS